MMARLLAGLISAALVMAALISALSLVLGAVVVSCLFFGGRRLWRQHRARVDARAHHRAELLARAEIQHRWYMAGDPRGTFGRYPQVAATKPPVVTR